MKNKVIDFRVHSRRQLDEQNRSSVDSHIDFRSIQHTSIFSDLSPHAFLAVVNVNNEALNKVASLLKLNIIDSESKEIKFLQASKSELSFKEDTLTLLAACLLFRNENKNFKFYLGTSYPLHEQIFQGCVGYLPTGSQKDEVIKNWAQKPSDSFIQFSNQLHLKQANFSVEFGINDSEIKVDDQQLNKWQSEFMQHQRGSRKVG